VVKYKTKYVVEDEQGRVKSGIDLVQSDASPAWFVPKNYEQGPSPREGEPAQWDYSAAATRNVVELHTRGVHVATASGSYGDAVGLNGINFSGKYTNDHELRNRAEALEAHTVEQYKVEGVVLVFDKNDLRPKPEFAADVEKIFAENQEKREVQYKHLHEKIFLNYGHFFPMEVVLGGKLLRTNHQIFTDVQSKERWLNEYAAAVGGKVTDESGGTITGQGGHTYSSTEERETALTKMYQKMQWMNIGGSRYKATDKTYNEWVNSLAPVSAWQPIEKRRLEPVISLLPDKLRRQCISLISEFAESSITNEHTPLDMAVYVNSLLAQELDGLKVI